LGFIMTKTLDFRALVKAFASRIAFQHLKLATAVFHRFAGDKKVIAHTGDAEDLFVKRGGIFRGFTPNGLGFDHVGDANKRIKHSCAHTPDVPSGILQQQGVDRRKLEHDVVTPRASAAAESQNGGVFEPIGFCQDQKGVFPIGPPGAQGFELRQTCRAGTALVVITPPLAGQLGKLDGITRMRITGTYNRAVPAFKQAKIRFCGEGGLHGAQAFFGTH
jgi:hypothetical protein